MLVYIIVVVIVLVLNFATNYQKEKKKKGQGKVLQQRKPVVVNRDGKNASLVPFSKRQSQVSTPVVDAEEIIDIANSRDKSIIDYPSLENGFNNTDTYQTIDKLLKMSTVVESESEESKAFNADKEETRIDIDLSSQDAVKKAFVSSLIFDRKY